MKTEMTDNRITTLLRGVTALSRRLRAERPPGSGSLAEISLLSTLKRCGPLPSAQLAAEEMLQPQSITRLVGALESKGWIARNVAPRDRRQIVISLTAAGRDILEAEIDARRKWLREALATTLTEDEQAALFAAAPVMLKLASFTPALRS